MIEIGRGDGEEDLFVDEKSDKRFFVGDVRTNKRSLRLRFNDDVGS